MRQNRYSSLYAHITITTLGMPKIEFRILEIRNLVGTVFHNCNIFGSVDSKIKRQFTGEKNFTFERNAINARQLREGRPVAAWIRVKT